jgi:hypothetical protein
MSLEYAAILRVYNSERYQKSNKRLLYDIANCRPPTPYSETKSTKSAKSTAPTTQPQIPVPESTPSIAQPKSTISVKHPIGNVPQELPIPRKPKQSVTTTEPTTEQLTLEPTVSRTGRVITKTKALEIPYDAPQLASKSLASRRQPTIPQPQPYVSKETDPTLPDYLPHQAVTIAEYYKSRRAYTTFADDHPLRHIVPLFPYLGTDQQFEQFTLHSAYFQEYYDAYESFLTRRLPSTSPAFDELITIILILNHNDKTTASPFTAAQASPALSSLTLIDTRLFVDLALPPNPALQDSHLPATEEEEDDNGSASHEPSVTKDLEESN